MKSRSVNLSPVGLEQFHEWIRTNQKLAGKIADLLEECAKTPFVGKGKPEPLKGNYKGYWSRRITDEHRLIYSVGDDYIYVFSCRGHYE